MTTIDAIEELENAREYRRRKDNIAALIDNLQRMNVWSYQYSDVVKLIQTLKIENS